MERKPVNFLEEFKDAKSLEIKGKFHKEVQ